MRQSFATILAATATLFSLGLQKSLNAQKTISNYDRVVLPSKTGHLD